jgi:hypothetical protein
VKRSDIRELHYFVPIEKGGSTRYCLRFPDDEWPESRVEFRGSQEAMHG